jgi:hypothetical protein
MVVADVYKIIKVHSSYLAVYATHCVGYDATFKKFCLLN